MTTSAQVQIRQVADEPQTWNPPTSGSDDPFTYIDISSIDPVEKRIVRTTKIMPSAAPSRARQLVRAGDVLVSTVRPNLNAVALVPEHLDGATASTGFAVLRPKAVIEPAYLFHWVRTSSFVAHLTARATGANYPAVTERTVRESRIPLPSFDEQRRIAAALDKTDAVRRKRREGQHMLRDLVASAYNSLVGVSNPSYLQWPELPIADLAEPHEGSTRTGPFGSTLRHAEFSVSGDVAVIGIDNVVENRFRWAKARFITRQRYTESFSRYAVRPGDVLVTIMGTTGRSAVAPADLPLTISTKHLAVITPDSTRVASEWLAHAIHLDVRVLGQITAAKRGAIMPGLNLSLIKRLRVKLPPINYQRSFAEVVRHVRQLDDRMTEATRADDLLFASLGDRAFNA